MFKSQTLYKLENSKVRITTCMPQSTPVQTDIIYVVKIVVKALSVFYRGLMESLVTRCNKNHLKPNVSKTNKPLEDNSVCP